MDRNPSADPLQRAREAFERKFGRPARWAASAPGRVNLIGEHTDYNDGLVLPIAIDRRTAAAAVPAADPECSRIFAADLNQTIEVDLRGDLTPSAFPKGSWISYLAGIFAGSGAGTNFDVTIASSVPIGSGLASSAALEVAVATVLEKATGAVLDPLRKVLLCQRAEQEFAGVPCGIMDQFVSVMARAGHALLIDCRTRQATHIPMPSADRAAIVLINTRVHHALASSEYATRRSTCASAARSLGLASLRDASSDIVEARRTDLTREQYLCARHVTAEDGRVIDAVEALRAHDLRELGRLMIASHASLRDDFRVSCPELDTVVEIAAAHPGVFGARMTGGGFGGCAIALCETRAVDTLTRALATGYRRKHARECDVFTTVAGDGAR